MERPRFRMVKEREVKDHQLGTGKSKYRLARLAQSCKFFKFLQFFQFFEFFQLFQFFKSLKVEWEKIGLATWELIMRYQSWAKLARSTFFVSLKHFDIWADGP